MITATQNIEKILMKKIVICMRNKEIIVFLLRKTKKAYYENLDDRRVSDNTLFEKSKAFTIQKI